MRDRVFSPEHREKIQAKLSHYLVRYRNTTNKTQKQMAEEMGYSLSAFRSFERSTSKENRILNALEIIKQCGDLEDMSAVEFVAYLTEDKVISSNTEQKKLRTWEKDLLAVLRRCDQSVRLAWSDSMLDFPIRNLSNLLKTQEKVARITDSHAMAALNVLLSKIKV